VGSKNDIRRLKYFIALVLNCIARDDLNILKPYLRIKIISFKDP